MTHILELKAYWALKGNEVDVHKERIELTGRNIVWRAKDLFKRMNVDCYNCPNNRIKIENYFIKTTK